ncbi:hypothetical protein Cfor_08280, partial [Coptotermes formosanus]
LLMSSEELRLFDKVRVYLDEDYSSAENFTALGNFYFIHESLSDVLIWDFSAMCFVPAKGKEVHSGNIEGVSTKEKAKFPQDFFPECKWSRKGFLRTRWSLSGSVFDLINIHLFHDASNFIAMESFPSVYCKNRRRALEHTLDRFHNDECGMAPFFVFGDFNFRTDTQGVVKKLAEGLNPVRLQSNKSTDHTKLQYRDGTSQVILSLGKKEFSHQDHQTVFMEENGKWLREFDRELEPFADRLYEFPITFQPSYPFEEDGKEAKCYMQTRCPSWCDRVLLSNSAKSLVSNINEPGSVQYGLMGTSTCMGDHKPVYLKMSLDSDAGIVPCDCSSESSPCFGLSADARVLPLQWPKSCNELSSKLDHAAVSSMLLATHCTTFSPVAVVSDSHLLLPPSAHASLLHDPYTPESMDTPSSSPTPSATPQFEFTVGYERESDSYLSMYGSTQSTKDKIYNWDFVLDSVEHIDGPDEDECADDENDCSNCKRDKSRNSMRPDIQERQHFGSGPKNETVLLTEKFASGRMAFVTSVADITPVGNSSLLSEAQDLLSLCQEHSDTDGQVLRQNVPAVFLETEHVEHSVALLSSDHSAVSNPAVIHVQSAVSVRRYSDRRPQDSSHEMQSCASQCNKSALLPHFVSHEKSCPVSNPVISTDNQTTGESDCTDEIKFVLPIRNSFVSGPTESVVSHKLHPLANSREQSAEVRQSSSDGVCELSRSLVLDKALSKLSNDKTTTHDCPVKHLFRSASVPANVCSTRIMEKQIPYLLVISRIHSCGDMSTSYSIQNESSVNGGEKLALNQQPCTEQNNSVLSAHTSFSEVPVGYNREKKRDQKLTDGQCFSCCILL